jgi:hypothetical protein
MGVSYWEAVHTPNYVINNDLEFAALENEYGKKPEEVQEDGTIRQQ